MKIEKLSILRSSGRDRVDSKAIKADRYIVGVCLGAQLLSVAYGAEYEHSPEREIGVFPVTLTPEGLTDPHVGDLEKRLKPATGMAICQE